MTTYTTLKVDELKKLCKEKGLSDAGKKSVLIERLNDLEASGASKRETEVRVSESKVEAPKSPVARVSSPARVSNGSVGGAEKPMSEMTDAERAIARAKRFGVANADLEKEKRKERAERFGTENADLEKDRRMARAERFGTANPDLEEQKRKERQERFGTQTESVSAADEDEKKRRREERFGNGKPAANGGPPAKKNKLDMELEPGKKDLDDEAKKKKAREARFGTA